VYTPDELQAVVDELGPLETAAVKFAAAPGLRPAGWAAIERRDVDKLRRVALVRGTKTHKSRREVPLTTAALTALAEVPPRIDSRYVFTTTRKVPGLTNRARSTSPTSDAACGHPRSTQRGS
jgi:integrase